MAGAPFVSSLGFGDPWRVRHGLTVHLYREPVTGPVRPAQRQRYRFLRGERQSELRRFAFGEGRVHAQTEPRFGPLRRRRGIECHPEGIVRLVVDPVTMQGVTLHAGAHAAREAPQHVLVLAPHTPTHRDHVAHPPVVRIDRAQDVIEQGAFVEVGVVGVGSDCEQPSRQLQHVVDVACLRSPPVDAAAQPIRGPKVLVGAVAARGEAVVLHHAVPEKGRCH